MAKLNFFEDVYMHLWGLLLWCLSIGFSLAIIVRGVLNDVPVDIHFGVFFLAFLIAGTIIAISSKYVLEFSW